NQNDSGFLKDLGRGRRHIRSCERAGLTAPHYPILRSTVSFAPRVTDGVGSMRRREFISLLGGALAGWPLATRAELQPKMLRVGFVGMQPREAPYYANFLKRMAELGYLEGRNFSFEYIQTPDIEGYEKNYRELAARKVDVFLAVGNEAALRAALSAADGKPIAFLAVD